MIPTTRAPYEVVPSRWPTVFVLACLVVLALVEFVPPSTVRRLGQFVDRQVMTWTETPAPTEPLPMISTEEYRQYLEQLAIASATMSTNVDGSIYIGGSGSNLRITSDGLWLSGTSGTASGLITTSGITWGEVSGAIVASPCSTGQVLVRDNKGGWACR